MERPSPMAIDPKIDILLTKRPPPLLYRGREAPKYYTIHGARSQKYYELIKRKIKPLTLEEGVEDELLKLIRRGITRRNLTYPESDSDDEQLFPPPGNRWESVGYHWDGISSSDADGSTLSISSGGFARVELKVVSRTDDRGKPGHTGKIVLNLVYGRNEERDESFEVFSPPARRTCRWHPWHLIIARNCYVERTSTTERPFIQGYFGLGVFDLAMIRLCDRHVCENKSCEEWDVDDRKYVGHKASWKCEDYKSISSSDTYFSFFFKIHGTSARLGNSDTATWRLFFRMITLPKGKNFIPNFVDFEGTRVRVDPLLCLRVLHQHLDRLQVPLRLQALPQNRDRLLRLRILLQHMVRLRTLPRSRSRDRLQAPLRLRILLQHTVRLQALPRTGDRLLRLRILLQHMVRLQALPQSWDRLRPSTEQGPPPPPPDSSTTHGPPPGPSTELGPHPGPPLASRTPPPGFFIALRPPPPLPPYFAPYIPPPGPSTRRGPLLSLLPSSSLPPLGFYTTEESSLSSDGGTSSSSSDSSSDGGALLSDDMDLLARSAAAAARIATQGAAAAREGRIGAAAAAVAGMSATATVNSSPPLGDETTLGGTATLREENTLGGAATLGGENTLGELATLGGLTTLLDLTRLVEDIMLVEVITLSNRLDNRDRSGEEATFGEGSRLGEGSGLGEGSTTSGESTVVPETEVNDENPPAPVAGKNSKRNKKKKAKAKAKKL
ncbi:hypothetical protein B0T19DRAFT_452035 [Cercophora scortea]|uniref:Uncharacterized protein n=1 Tax=Cercophora scortea TaxID=314031 RepID=A0AAE0MK70_9PEZI|nr:hypothetical protein B0T19DRAFT_452035 [Cercophora scortea]